MYPVQVNLTGLMTYVKKRFSSLEKDVASIANETALHGAQIKQLREDLKGCTAELLENLTKIFHCLASSVIERASARASGASNRESE